jgi:hypothetical protein
VTRAGAASRASFLCGPRANVAIGDEEKIAPRDCARRQVGRRVVVAALAGANRDAGNTRRARKNFFSTARISVAEISRMRTVIDHSSQRQHERSFARWIEVEEFERETSERTIERVTEGVVNGGTVVLKRFEAQRRISPELF